MTGPIAVFVETRCCRSLAWTIRSPTSPSFPAAESETGDVDVNDILILCSSTFAYGRSPTATSHLLGFNTSCTRWYTCALWSMRYHKMKILNGFVSRMFKERTYSVRMLRLINMSRKLCWVNLWFSWFAEWRRSVQFAAQSFTADYYWFSLVFVLLMLFLVMFLTYMLWTSQMLTTLIW